MGKEEEIPSEDSSEEIEEEIFNLLGVEIILRHNFLNGSITIHGKTYAIEKEAWKIDLELTRLKNRFLSFPDDPLNLVLLGNFEKKFIKPEDIEKEQH